MDRVFHFSGGRTSAMMVLLYWQPGDLVIFCDTTREDEGTYQFVRDFEANTGIPVIWVVGDWKGMIKKGRMVPNRFKRRCTIELKVRAARRYLRSIGWFRYIQFVGFRADEMHRVADYHHQWKAVTTIFPLAEDNIKEPEILMFWQPVAWKLSTPKILGNCDLCFLKGEAAIMAILQQYPERAGRWMADEEDRELNPNGYTYFKGKTIRQLRDAAQGLKKQYPLDDINPQFSCACTQY